MIISRYLLKEVCHALVAVTLILLLIFLSNQLVRFLNYAASGKIAVNVLFQLMGFEVSFLLALLLPLGLYLGIIATYGRLYADNELRVMQAYGMSTQKLVQITGGLAFSVAVIVLVFTLIVNPFIAVEKDKLISQSLTAGNLLNTLTPGRFQPSGDESRIFYVETLSRNHQQANNIFVAEQKKSPLLPWIVLSASKAYQMIDPISKDKFVVAVDGYRYEGTPGQNDYKIIQFKKYAVRIPDQTIISQHQAQEVIPTNLLWKNYFQNPKDAAELQWRVSMPLSAFLLALLAIPLSYIRPRQSRYAQFLPAILIYIIYVELLFVARDWVEQKTVPIVVGVWWVHLLLIFVILLLFNWQSGKLFFMRKNQ